MFAPSVAVWELILRAAIIYVFVFVVLRMLGKKHVGEMAPFDLVILLILSEAVQNALVADDKSVAGGLIVAGTLFGISQVMGYVTWKSKRAERFLDGAPRIYAVLENDGAITIGLRSDKRAGQARHNASSDGA